MPRATYAAMPLFTSSGALSAVTVDRAGTLPDGSAVGSPAPTLAPRASTNDTRGVRPAAYDR